MNNMVAREVRMAAGGKIKKGERQKEKIAVSIYEKNYLKGGGGDNQNTIYTPVNNFMKYLKQDSFKKLNTL